MKTINEMVYELCEHWYDLHCTDKEFMIECMTNGYSLPDYSNMSDDEIKVRYEIYEQSQ